MNRASLLNTTIGEYRVTEFLGAGGMGEVYRAVHARIGHSVALKALKADAVDSTYRERFTHEARIQSRLHHPNIVAFYEFLECRGQRCIIMEFVDGQTLADRLRFGGPLRVREALRIFAAVTDAVAYIHSHGIIHRDLKSNNIKISADGRVRLLDFGIAREILMPRLTQTGVVVGALESVSPEQLAGHQATERSDIWALGVLLYEMLTGRVPFEARSVTEICQKTSRGTYPQPSTLNPSVPREVETLIARCLRKNPADRFQSASALLAEIHRVIANLSAPAQTQLRRWPALQTAMQQHQQAIVLLTVLAILIGILTWSRETHDPALRTVEIRLTEGSATVLRDDGSHFGNTPLRFKAKPGERFNLRLRREGYVEKEAPIQVNENDNDNRYDYTLEKISPQS
jgi:serine/threonine-protein kinase